MIKNVVYNSVQEDIRSRPEYRKRFLELYKTEFTLEKREAYYAKYNTHDLAYKLMQQASLEIFLADGRMLRFKKWLANK